MSNLKRSASVVVGALLMSALFVGVALAAPDPTTPAEVITSAVDQSKAQFFQLAPIVVGALVLIGFATWGVKRVMKAFGIGKGAKI